MMKMECEEISEGDEKRPSDTRRAGAVAPQRMRNLASICLRRGAEQTKHHPVWISSKLREPATESSAFLKSSWGLDTALAEGELVLRGTGSRGFELVCERGWQLRSHAPPSRNPHSQPAAVGLHRR